MGEQTFFANLTDMYFACYNACYTVLLLIFIQNVDRAGKAQQTGAFNKEITPVTTKVTDKDGNEHTVTVCDI